MAHLKVDSQPQRDAGSFRDPGGYVFSAGSEIFRSVNKSAADSFVNVLKSGVLERLSDKGLLISAKPCKFNKSGLAAFAGVRGEVPAFVLQHPRVPFISYPYEWVFSQLKDAAIAHLELQIAALEEGFVFTDATAYNMQFLNGKPVHIDVLSLRAYRDGESWSGYNQFCRQFLFPLLVEAWTGMGFQTLYRGRIDGISFEDAMAILPRHKMFSSLNGFLHVFLHAKAVMAASSSSSANAGQMPHLAKNKYQAILGQLKEFIIALHSKRRSPTYWQNYAALNSYSDEMRDTKLCFVGEWASRSVPETVWDIGGNTGDYAAAALKGGAKSAIVLDSDIDSLEGCYRTKTRGAGNILPVLMNLGDPSPGLGWRESERKALSTRSAPDGMIALAVIHHMCIRGNLPLADVIDWMIGIAPSGIIEFVPKQDPMVQQLLQSRDDIFHDYTETVFRQAVQSRASITKEHRFVQNGRLLVSFERKPTP